LARTTTTATRTGPYACGVRPSPAGRATEYDRGMIMDPLDKQVALVTGGGTGIGRATALALARRGARVVVVGRRAGPLEETAAAVTAGGGEAWAAPVDVGDPDGTRRLVEDVVDRWSRLDVLVNNAGLNVARRDMAGLSVADWDAILRVTLNGTFLMTHAALPAMRARRSGTIVNISSMAGYRASALTGPAYNAAKAGVNSFTESVNLAERRHGIRACAVCPGEVSTPILENRPVPPSAEARATMLQPEDIADTVVFVATLPQRANVELLTIYPTDQRDWTSELR
jgi:NADP-dependent 3-hydroxy acid dehydrogenase YdfG